MVQRQSSGVSYEPLVRILDILKTRRPKQSLLLLFSMGMIIVYLLTGYLLIVYTTSHGLQWIFCTVVYSDD